MTFTDSLRLEAKPLFDAVRANPFVQGIASASLLPNQLIHYVRQDFQYLSTYARVYALALAKCSSREEMRMFHERIGFILNEEIHPHLNLCRAAGVSYRDLQEPGPLAPTAHHYANHMIAVAQAGTLGEIVATILPCHWMYVDLAEHLTETVHPAETHPFYDWITFYASPTMKANLKQLLDWLNTYANLAGSAEQVRMTQAFLYSCHLENRFFNMAYDVEDWLSEGEASRP